MQMTLEKWQERLERNFAKLAKDRSGSDLPIFALEHGLGERDRRELSKQLRAHQTASMPPQDCWLVWVVYAAEEGYTYAGKEYWSSFEEQIPNWEIQYRDRIRSWYRKFKSEYNGFSPSSLWARNFGIIAWPITHAVLPVYLQRQFAEVLFTLRLQLFRLSSIEPAAIGRMIAANACCGSTRLEEFLQQEELVGRIVLAILGKNSRKGEEPLLQVTLERIVYDLEKVRQSREWLKETRFAVSNRFAGIGQGSGRQNHRFVRSDDQREREPEIKPDILFRHTSNDTWTLVMDVPSFSNLATQKPEVRDFLRGTRCSLNGGEGKKPKGWVLSGKRRAVLKSWPDHGKPLLRFEQNHFHMDRLLGSECLMTGGPVWLFRIGSDGIAREIKGLMVRPSSNYIIARKERIVNLLDHMRVCFVDCTGIEAIRISVPTDVSTEYINWLKAYNLSLAQTIRVWPAGLPARNWDGEGRSEWLTTERPCVGILHDHPVDSYVINLNKGKSEVVPAGKAGHPKFIQLPYLNVGMNHLTVTARKNSEQAGFASKSTHEGFLELRVREPAPWIPGTAAHMGLIVSGDPHDASLGTFWENKYALSVIGPDNRSVSATVTLEGRKGEEILRGKVLEMVKLPITPVTWQKRFSDFLKRKRCAGCHFEASAGILQIDGQELGKCSIRFEHEALPFRWVCRRRQGKLTVRLIDDRERAYSDLTCSYFGLDKPLKLVRLDVEKLLADIDVQSPGGLFVAQSRDHQDLMIVSPVIMDDGFKGFGVASDYGRIDCDPKSLSDVLRFLNYWYSARPIDVFAATRQMNVVDELLRRVFHVLCGSRWAKAENRFVSSLADLRMKRKRAEDELRAEEKLDIEMRLQAKIGNSRRFGAALRIKAAEVPNSINAMTQWYVKIAKTYSVCDDADLCALAIRLVSNPYQVLKFYSENFETVLGRLAERPALLRGARFVALLWVCANHESEVGAVVPRWKE